MDVSIEFKMSSQHFNRLFLRALHENFERFDFAPATATRMREFLMQELTRQSVSPTPAVDFSGYDFAKALVSRMCQEVCINMDGMLFYSTAQDRHQMVNVVEEAFLAAKPSLSVLGPLEPKV